MSAAFTTLSSGENAQSLAMANEIVLAYSERRQALGQSAVSPLVAGDNAQDKGLWLGMQTWLESNCTSFIDHVNGPLNPAGTDFLYFTLATWRAAAGLNAIGFQRSTDGSTMLYGKIQFGDVRGKWCFEDLQKGFGALKWSPWVTTGWTGDQYASDTDGDADFNEAKTEAQADFSLRYTGAIDPFCISVVGYDSSAGPYAYYAGIKRHSLYVYANALPAISRIPVLYAKGSMVGGIFDGNGDVTANFAVVDTLGVSVDINIFSSHFRNASFPIWGAEPPDDHILYSRGYSHIDSSWLLKWDFTNA
jgi:hypothetical protein